MEVVSVVELVEITLTGIRPHRTTSFFFFFLRDTLGLVRLRDDEEGLFCAQSTRNLRNLAEGRDSEAGE